MAALREARLILTCQMFCVPLTELLMRMRQCLHIDGPAIPQAILFSKLQFLEGWKHKRVAAARPAFAASKLYVLSIDEEGGNGPN